MASLGSTLLALAHGASSPDHQLKHCLSALWSSHPPCLDALLVHFRFCNICSDRACFISRTGVEGIFLILAMKNMTNDSVHNLLIIIGLIVPITIVSFVLGSSLTSEENIYLTNYDANGRLLLHASSFEDMNTICWLRPDYIIKLVNLPLGFVQLTQPITRSTFPSASSSSPTLWLFSQRSPQLTSLQSSGEFTFK